jgi:hypothetical protein
MPANALRKASTEPRTSRAIATRRGMSVHPRGSTGSSCAGSRRRPRRCEAARPDYETVGTPGPDGPARAGGSRTVRRRPTREFRSPVDGPRSRRLRPCERAVERPHRRPALSSPGTAGAGLARGREPGAAAALQGRPGGVGSMRRERPSPASRHVARPAHLARHRLYGGECPRGLRELPERWCRVTKALPGPAPKARSRAVFRARVDVVVFIACGHRLRARSARRP